MVQLLTARVLSDIEGFVLLKKKQFGRKVRQFVRIHGGVLSVHNNEKTAVTWDANLIGCEVRHIRRRSFTISLASGLSLFITLASATDESAPWVTVLGVSSRRRLENAYELAEKVGEGAFASVHRARVKQTNEIVAIKTIVKRQFDTTMARELDREVLACGSLRVPGIIRTREVYNTQDKVHLVMDLMPGGTLKDRVQDVGGHIPEIVAAPIVADTLQALAHLHRIGVAHRDVKLENVLCETPTLPTSKTLLCDFGYVNFLEPGAETMRSLVGTPVYVAPEIVDRRTYGTPVDVWAAGVMAYRMIGGSYPFDGGEDDEKTMDLIAAGELQFAGPRWKHVSNECISFLKALLHPNPGIRLSAEGALHHPWIIAHRGSECVESTGSPISSAASPQSETSIAAAALSKHAPFTSGEASVTEGKKRDIHITGNRLAQRVSHEMKEPIRASGTTADTVALCKPYSTRTRFRLLVCMIVFRTRLQVAAGHRRPPQPLQKSPRAPVVPVAPSVHPAQFVEDDIAPVEVEGSLASSASFSAVTAGMDISPEVDKPIENEFIAAQTEPLPDRAHGDRSGKRTPAIASQQPQRATSLRKSALMRSLSIGARSTPAADGSDASGPRRFDSIKRIMSVSIGTPRAQPPTPLRAS